MRGMEGAALTTPKRLPPPPRKVRKARGAGMRGMGCARVFILPHLLVGIGFLCYMLLTLGWALLGWDVQGSVMRKWEDSDSDSTSYHVEYTFVVGDRVIRDTAQVGAEFYSKLPERFDIDRPEVRMPVRVFGAMGRYYTNLLSPKWGPWSTVGFAWMFGLFWNSIVGVFVIFLYVYPVLIRWLIAHGAAVEGRILGKSVDSSGDSTTYRIEYVFSPDGKETVKGKYQIFTKEEYDAVKESSPVTVIYWPGKPKRNVPLEHSGYRVVE